jgi:hypothetical protein
MYNKSVEFVKLKEVDTNPKFHDLMVEAIRKPTISKISTDDAILMVLSAVDHQKSVISRTLLQREVFLFYESVCKEYGISDGASDAGFFPYKYGPYSIDVNLALSALIVSGSVMVENYYSDEFKNKRFLAKFVTKVDFIDIADKYRDLLASRGLSVDKFLEILRVKKHGWDQSLTAGINEQLRSLGYSKWFIVGMSLEKVLPNITFGKITEDYIPRGEKLARD